MGNFFSVLEVASSRRQHSQLMVRPQSIASFDVSFIILLFILRAFKTSLASFTESFSPRKEARQHVLSLSLSMPLRLTREDVDAYQRAIAARPGKSTAPISDVFQACCFFSALTEPAMLLLLVKRPCPINPLGAVNVRNHFELHTSHILDETDPSQIRVEKVVEGKNLSILASLAKPPVPVKRGFEYELEVSLMDDSDATIFCQHFTMLEFAQHRSDLRKSQHNDMHTEAAATQRDDIESERRCTFNVSQKDPLSWAQLCKDYNPIHTSWLIANLLGFPGQIAHGTHILARALQTHASQYTRPIPDPRALQFKSASIDVYFKRPVPVPAELDCLFVSRTNDTAKLTVSRKGKEDAVTALLRYSQC